MGYNLAKLYCHPTNYSNYRTANIQYIAPHHAVMISLSQLDRSFGNANWGASTHEGIQGIDVHRYLEPGQTAWAMGEWNNNCIAYSFEMINESIGYPYPIAESTFITAAQRTADLLKMFGLGRPIYGVNIKLHRDVVATACPGDWFVQNLSRWLVLVDKYYLGEEDDMPTPYDMWSMNLPMPHSDKEFPAWQHLVWARQQTIENGAHIAALTEAVKVLAQSKGADPDEIAKEVGNAVAKKLESIKLAVTTE